jgi:citrate lyase beta subunit
MLRDDTFAAELAGVGENCRTTRLGEGDMDVAGPATFSAASRPAILIDNEHCFPSRRMCSGKGNCEQAWYVPMRSKLFVPGSRPELFAKAVASQADAISIDLEDAVEESRKVEARAAVSSFLNSRQPGADGKVMIVRVNAPSTPHFDADLQAIVGPALDLANLPMAESPQDVSAAAEAFSCIERARGIEKPIGLLVNIETPRALRLAAEIAKAAPRVVGLQLGFGDLFEPLGIDRSHAAAVEQVQLTLRLAAGEAGVWAYDSAYANVKDVDGYRREAEIARRLGFVGKSCIHPSQIALANEVFRPTDREIAHALRVVAASEEAKRKGIGAYMVDGRMVDAPFARRAEDIVALAGRLGLLPQAQGPNP